jgi:Tol biopolymer transport system component
MKRKERPDSPSCPLSIHCLRLLDELDVPKTPANAEGEPEPSTHHGDEFELLSRLRRHLPECQICSSLVAQARHERDHQRQLLRQFLEDAEHRTPSTQELIMQAIRSSQTSAEAEQESLATLNHADHSGQNQHRRLPFAVLSRLPELTAQQPAVPRAPRRSPLLETLVLAAVILVVLLTTGSLGYLLLRDTSSQAPASSPPTAISVNASYQSLVWKAIAMVDPFPDGTGRYHLYNYDPFSGQKRLLTSTCCDATSAVDGIAHSGRDLLYHDTLGKARLFRTLSHPEPLFSCSCSQSSAVWTTDDSHLLISAGSELFLVNLSGNSEPIYSSDLLQNSTLAFYYNDFLFFIHQEKEKEVLYRLDLANGEIRSIASRPLTTDQGVPASTSSRRNAWLLNPTGSTIYYSAGSGLGATLYMVNSDGSNLHSLNRHGIPLGFAEDNRLLFLQETNGAFEVRKLGATPQQDQLVVVNAAPGARSVLTNGLALAPYGWALLTEALYPDHSLRLWATNLMTHAQKLLLSVPAAQVSQLGTPQVVGWDQLPVSNEATPTPSTNQAPGNTLLNDDWNGLLLVSGDQSGQLTVSNYNYASGQLLQLLSALPAQTEIDGISPDGSSLAYHIPSTSQTDYYVLDLRMTPPLIRFQYHVSGSGGNAIWLNAQTLLLNTPTALLRVNMQQLQPKAVMAALPDTRLAFYSAPYLYFVGRVGSNQQALFRLPLGGTFDQRQAITPPVQRASTDFWLSPDGRTIYYVNYHSEAPGIYAVDSDGGNRHRLRPWGVPIGYAEDNSLMVMRYRQGSFEVVKLGLTPAQDQVLLQNAAPGASTLCAGRPIPATPVDAELICSNNVALAPYGHHLVVQAYYPDGHSTLLAYNLDNGQQLSAQAAPTSKLIGYNRYPPA